MMHLQGAPRRAPLSDWLAQIERHIERRTRERMTVTATPIIQALYDCGVTPREVADDILSN